MLAVFSVGGIPTSVSATPSSVGTHRVVHPIYTLRMPYDGYYPNPDLPSI